MNYTTIKSIIFLSIVTCILNGMDNDLCTSRLSGKDFERLGVTYLNTIDPESITLEMVSFFEEDFKDGTVTAEHIAWGQKLQCPVRAAIYLKYINKKIGYGVFAQSPIQAGEVVDEYAGQIMDLYTLETEEKLKDVHASDYWHMTAPWGRYFVDAKKAGNLTRFINHSYSANTIAQEAFSDSVWRIAIIAKKFITTDQQLTLNYGSNYWDSRGVDPEKLS